ncbi:MAG: HIRAN domain-containing protein [Eubacteriales bacterium]|nr:HIRAN domain-containing protein [Eubacteriales bacterium]
MTVSYFTITGLNHYFGSDFIKPGMKVKLEKDHDNKFDKEAIKVLMKGLGQIGYVANSTYTVLGESMSAGRMYDKIGETAKGRVVYVLPTGVICELKD